jgi:flagellar biosynthetic protein FlhB
MPPGENKTEKPTPRRLEKARKEGNVAQSPEMLSVATLFALVSTTALVGPWFVNWFRVQIEQGLSCDVSAVADIQTFASFINQKIIHCILIMSPFLAALMVAGIGGNLAVSGLNFSTKALKWKMDKLNPVTGLKNLFSAESLVKLGMSIVKLIFISLIVWLYLKDKMYVLSRLQWVPADQILNHIAGIIFGVVIRIVLSLVGVGVVDMIYRKWRYKHKLKMSKQEVKDEHRDTDGAPEIKSKIRQKQMQAAMQRMLQDVPKANVVLVNPTHVAVALQYDPNTMNAPVMLAKGGDHMCEKIKEVARANGVPIIRRPGLARELYATVKIGHTIPEMLFTAVAEILAMLYRIRHNR